MHRYMFTGLLPDSLCADTFVFKLRGVFRIVLASLEPEKAGSYDAPHQRVQQGPPFHWRASFLSALQTAGTGAGAGISKGLPTGSMSVPKISLTPPVSLTRL